MTRIIRIFYMFIGIAFAGASAAPGRDLIFIIKSSEIEPYKVAIESLRQTLKGVGLDPDFREQLLPEDRQGRSTLLSDIQKSGPRLLVTVGSAATDFVSNAERNIPVVFCMVLNPTASGLASRNRLTGASLDIPPQVQFEALRSIVPSVRKIGVVYNPLETDAIVQQARQAAREMRLELVPVRIDSEKKVPEALRKLQEEQVDALWSVADGTTFSSGAMEYILMHTLRNHLPFMGLSKAFVKAGALIALEADYQEVGAQCGKLVAKILGGEDSSSLPIATPQKTTRYINLTTAETIGFSLRPNSLKGAVVFR